MARVILACTEAIMWGKDPNSDSPFNPMSKAKAHLDLMGTTVDELDERWAREQKAKEEDALFKAEQEGY